jgi:hypothetical protein
MLARVISTMDIEGLVGVLLEGGGASVLVAEVVRESVRGCETCQQFLMVYPE